MQRSDLRNQYAFTLSTLLVEAVDKARGKDFSRSALVEHLLHEWLLKKGGRVTKARDIRKPNSRSHRTPLTVFHAEGL